MSKKELKIVICEVADTYRGDPGLTSGAEYVVIKEEDNKYFIKNDHGKKTSYYKSRFRTK